MVDEEVSAHSAMVAGQPNQLFQVRLMLLREFIHGTLDAVIEVDDREAVVALRGLLPCRCQLWFSYILLRTMSMSLMYCINMPY